MVSMCLESHHQNQIGELKKCAEHVMSAWSLGELTVPYMHDARMVQHGSKAMRHMIPGHDSAVSPGSCKNNPKHPVSIINVSFKLFLIVWNTQLSHWISASRAVPQHHGLSR